MRAIPMIAQERWAILLARLPPGDRRAGSPPSFPAPLPMAAAREVGAELVISRRSLLGDRHADSTGITLAMAGPANQGVGLRQNHPPGRTRRSSYDLDCGRQRVPDTGNAVGRHF
eukprot:597991-Pyramimonas_sp.AAC.1